MLSAGHDAAPVAAAAPPAVALMGTMRSLHSSPVYDKPAVESAESDSGVPRHSLVEQRPLVPQSARERRAQHRRALGGPSLVVRRASAKRQGQSAASMKLGVRQLLVGVLLGVLLYGAVVAYAGFRQIQAVLGEFRWAAFAAALGLASANYGFRFAKWQYYLRRLGVARVPRVDSLLVFLSGFVLTVTPGKLGEVFKSAVLARTHQVPVERTAPIVVAERLTDVIAIVLLVVLGSLGFSGGLYWALLGAVAVGAGLIAILWERPVRSLLAALGKTRRAASLVPRLARAYDSLRLVASPSALGWPVLLSLFGWGLEGLALHLLIGGFGYHPALSFSVFFYATATLAGALVPVPGGLGVTEAVIHEQLVHVAGMPENVATACMLLIRLATLWWAVLVGFLALALLRLRFPRELGAASAGPEPEPPAPADSPPGSAPSLSRRA